MAIVSTVNTNWRNLTGKTNSRQSALTSKLKESVIDVALGCADNYVTGGIVTDLSACGTITTIVTASVNEVSVGLNSEYNPVALCAASTATIQFYESAGAGLPMTELACASCETNCITFKVHVIGF